MDGGDVIFDSYEDGVVKLRLRGSCHGCPSSMMTLKMGIERRLREEYPEIVSVEAV
jgi:Fe-S cluster biogenesis protein NfuA